VQRKSLPTFCLLGSFFLALAPTHHAAPLAGNTAQPARTLAFGEPALIETAVLRATGILLAADEHLRAISQPDSERWQVDSSEYGPEGAKVPVVTVTPSDCGLSTNLLLLTTRRVYALDLKSAPCDLDSVSSAEPSFDALVRFRYPQGELTRDLPPPPPAPQRETVPVTVGIERIAENAARFTWQAKNGYRGPKPVLVTEDDHTTYLVFAKGSWRTQDLPLFFLVNEKGDRELTNFDVTGETFVIRTRFEKAVLVAGSSKARRQPYLLLSRKP
jgi:type IV secretion system protein TrbG